MGLSITGLTKSYSGVTVLEGVDLTVARGEVHALLGANGSGKSTLIKCVSGAVTPDAGSIQIAGRRFDALTPREAHREGVAVVYQELSVATSLGVTDNIFLGQELRRGPFVRRKDQRVVVRDLLGRLGSDLDPDAHLSGLGNAELQIVEILKALCRNPTILILDEPTSALTKTEADRLAVQVRALKQQGLPILYVTHRLGEVFAIADKVTVLRGGRVVISASTDDVSDVDLVTAIAGRSVQRAHVSADTGTPAPAPILCVESLVAPGIGPIDLKVRPNEILGVFGLVGSGRTELLESLFGARRRYSGRIELNGKPLSVRRPGDAVAAGIALVPSDRLRKSLFPTLRASDNVLLARLRALAAAGIRRRGAERRSFAQATEHLNLQPRRSDLEARRFSGGNQQKLVLGRWFGSESDRCHVLLLDEPTQGVDVGARNDLYRVLREFASGGRAVVVTSSEPEELMQLADQVAVLSRGRLVGLLTPQEITEHRLLSLAHLGDEVAPAQDVE